MTHPCCRACARGGEGRIINLTSVAAQLGSTMGVHYAAAKAMVTANPNIKPDMIPVGRFGDVDECADVAVLLAVMATSPARRSGSTAGMFM
jgi:3-oxoacyl-[acyl-carrier protein] reductase